MLIGSIPMTIGVWLLAFWPLRVVVGGYQQARQRRRMRPPRPPEASEPGP